MIKKTGNKIRRILLEAFFIIFIICLMMYPTLLPSPHHHPTDNINYFILSSIDHLKLPFCDSGIVWPLSSNNIILIVPISVMSL